MFARLSSCAIVLLLAGSLASPALAEPTMTPVQLAPADAQRDCQTIRTCNFSRRGAFRGCLSSYSCRRCRTVRVKCRMDAGRRICHEVRCDWGA